MEGSPAATTNKRLESKHIPFRAPGFTHVEKHSDRPAPARKRREKKKKKILVKVTALDNSRIPPLLQPPGGTRARGATSTPACPPEAVEHRVGLPRGGPVAVGRAPDASGRGPEAAFHGARV